MKNVGMAQRRRRTEKAIIDALLKISEIVQKTEINRPSAAKLIKRRSLSVKTGGEGDVKQVLQNDDEDENEQQQVPVPPPMRTLDSYVSNLNQQQAMSFSSQRLLNFNRAPNKMSHPWNSQQILQKKRPISNHHHRSNSHKHHRINNHDLSSTSFSSYSNRKSNHSHRQKSSQHHRSNHKSSSRSNPTSNHIEQPTQTISTATTIVDDPSSSVMIDSAPVTIIEPNLLSPSVNTDQQQMFSLISTIDTKTDLDMFIDQQLQATLEKHVRSHSLPSASNDAQRQARLAILTQSETGKLMDDLDFAKQICHSDQYEKERQSAMLAAKQGNFALSYSIYTNLLHNNQYDYKFKSEILASRATILLLEEKCFQAIDDCTQAIAFNQWNKLAYVVRAACWMIKQEYGKAVDDYSKLFHFFDQSQHVLDLLNLAYEQLKLFDRQRDDEQSIPIEQQQQTEDKEDQIEKMTKKSSTTQALTSPVGTCADPTQSLSMASPTASFIQPAVYLCYPYQAYPTWYANNTGDEQQQQQQTITPNVNTEEIHQPTYILADGSLTSQPSTVVDQSLQLPPISNIPSSTITRQTSLSSSEQQTPPRPATPLAYIPNTFPCDHPHRSSFDSLPTRIDESKQTSMPYYQRSYPQCMYSNNNAIVNRQSSINIEPWLHYPPRYDRSQPPPPIVPAWDHRQEPPMMEPYGNNPHSDLIWLKNPFRQSM